MRVYSFSHEIHCSEARFWEVFFDRSFNETLFREELGFPTFDIISQEEHDGATTRIIRGKPKMNMPKAVMKVLGENFGYEETGTLDPKTKRWNWTMKPNTLADKLFNTGCLWIEPLGEDRCKRMVEMRSEAKIFGVGGLIEKTSEAEFRAGWDASAIFMNKWLADHPSDA